MILCVSIHVVIKRFTIIYYFSSRDVITSLAVYLLKIIKYFRLGNQKQASAFRYLDLVLWIAADTVQTFESRLLKLNIKYHWQRNAELRIGAPALELERKSCHHPATHEIFWEDFDADTPFANCVGKHFRVFLSWISFSEKICEIDFQFLWISSASLLSKCIYGFYTRNECDLVVYYRLYVILLQITSS